jgi:uncharacterized repeat protein (TIGR04052 family)
VAARAAPIQDRGVLRALAASALLLLSACAPAPAVEVTFEVVFGGAPFECGRAAPLGASSLALDDLRLYVHDVRAIAADGTEIPMSMSDEGDWQESGVALLDFEARCSSVGDEGTNVRVVLAEPWPAGAVGLAFRIGVPFELNHMDVAVSPPPLNRTALYWGWNGGYDFVRASGRVGDTGAFLFLLGSTGCEGDGRGNVERCARSNRPDVRLDAMDPTRDRVVLDLDRFFEASAPSPSGGLYCMSDPAEVACAPLFDRLGIPFDGSAGTASFVRREPAP